MELKQALKNFGLNENEQEVYLLLSKYGWITALELSRKSSLKRTTLYRILESLIHKGLAETQVGDKTTHYNAADPKQFESLVIEQESRAKKLRDSLSDIQSVLSFIPKNQHDTSVRFYKGIRGIKQMDWKLLECTNNQMFIFDAGSLWYQFLGKEFAEEIRNEIVKKNILVYEIANKEKSEPIPEDAHPTWTDNIEYVKNHFRGRVIPTKQFEITQEIYVVENIVHIHGYRENDIMGIEIVSPDYAKFMQQLFKLLWKQAEVFDNFGGKIF
jgi:sugar-specific transcriptional regulator TrmB